MVDIEIGPNVLRERLAALTATDLSRLTGGQSSLTYAASVTVDGVERRVVVKVAPAGLEPVRNRDVLRQARIIDALHRAGAPVPEVLWQDGGDPPDVPPLFVMSLVEGTSFEPLFDPAPTDGSAEPATVVSERLRHATDVLASLHAVDPGAIELGEEPVVGIAHEIDRWVRSLQTVDQSAVAGWERVADTLHATAPTPMRPSVVHGDYRLGNTLARGGRVTAVIDWEIWSVGDPRTDLGWFLANADPRTYRRPSPYIGRLPDPTELADIYSERLGRAVDDLAWFRALACFKSVAIWALILKHNARRADPDPVATEIATVLPDLLARALDLVR